MPLYKINAKSPFFHFSKYVHTVKDKDESTNPSHLPGTVLVVGNTVLNMRNRAALPKETYVVLARKKRK